MAFVEQSVIHTFTPDKCPIPKHSRLEDARVIYMDGIRCIELYASRACGFVRPGQEVERVSAYAD